MLVDLLLVERVDLRRLSGSAGRNNFLSDRFDRCLAATGEKNLSSFACKSARGWLYRSPSTTYKSDRIVGQV
jgi:hypothetical protein